MKIKDVLQRDPGTFPLVNQGQARIVDSHNEKALEELRGELSTFVCEGQYADGVQKIIRSDSGTVPARPTRRRRGSVAFSAAVNHTCSRCATCGRTQPFPTAQPREQSFLRCRDELRELLRELDTAGRRAGGLLAAAGSLPSGTTDQVRLTILGILMRAVGLPEQYPQARFCLWLHAQGDPTR